MALSYSHGFATKSTFSVAMVAMTDNTTSSNPNVPVSTTHLKEFSSRFKRP